MRSPRRVRHPATLLRLKPWQLPELAMLSVAIGDSADTRLGGGDDEFDGGLAGVAVPVVPEVC